MIYGSLCSGIEAATQAWHPLGWKPAFFSEIEKFPSAVLAHHYPDVPNYGDMTRFAEWPDHAIDLLVGGTPCQSFSVAGLRKGLADPRGNLMLTFGAVAQKYQPRWIVWENVPGVLSSDGGRDFGTFLGMLAELGYGFAYRVLDAQYVRTCRHSGAVPQRRRRVFVVGYLGDWRRAAAVLFDGESLSGNPPPRREARERAAPTISARPTGGGWLGTDFDIDGGLIADVAPTLNASFGEKQGLEDQHINGGCGLFVAKPIFATDGQANAAFSTEIALTLPATNEAPHVAHTLKAGGFDSSEDGTGRGTPIIAIQERAVSENLEAGPQGAGFRDDGAAYTLEARNKVQAVAFDCKGTEVQYAVDGSHPTLRSMGHNNSHQNAGGHAAVAFDPNQITSKANRSIPRSDVLHTIPATENPPHLATEWAVRRLTPVECERLQGFPDNFTRIPGASKGSWREVDDAEDIDELRAAGLSLKMKGNAWFVRDPDGPRYKALGNSMAVNVMTWIGERIALVHTLSSAEDMVMAAE